MPLVPLSGPAASLMETLRVERVTQTDAQIAIQQFLSACSPLSAADRQIQFDQLLSIVDESPTGPACFLSVVCGALLEQGAWPGRMGEIIQRKLEEILPPAAYLARECQKREAELARRPESFASSDEEEAFEERLDRAKVECFESVSANSPLARAAWEHLGVLWPACIALYSRDVAARVRGRVFLPMLAPLVDRHEGAHWLQKLLPVLDRESLLVIDPARSIGITAIMSGVSDNFQLQTLLMDVFPRRWLEWRRVSRRVVDVATGVGPQESGDVVTGHWNMYQGAALHPLGQLPGPQATETHHWIWGEGVPSDIPVIDGFRVVLLGPASYPRTWPSVRLFRSLQASLTDVHVLSTTGVREWVGKLTGLVPSASGR